MYHQRSQTALQGGTHRPARYAPPASSPSRSEPSIINPRMPPPSRGQKLMRAARVFIAVPQMSPSFGLSLWHRRIQPIPLYGWRRYCARATVLRDRRNPTYGRQFAHIDDEDVRLQRGSLPVKRVSRLHWRRDQSIFGGQLTPSSYIASAARSFVRMRDAHGVSCLDGILCQNQLSCQAMSS